MTTQTMAADAVPAAPGLRVRRITLEDLRIALRQGYEDFTESRVHLIVLALIYPVLGLVLARAASGDETLPLIYPLVSGFALLGPFAAVGLYEMSKRRERGLPVTWGSAFAILRSPRLGAILLLGLMLGALFVVWLNVAHLIFRATLGPSMPFGQMVHQALTTRAGLELMVFGNAAGFVFAVAALILGVVAFPLLVDRDIGGSTAEQASIALMTSARAVMANPVPMAAWGAIVAGCLMLGSIPLLVGLAVVMPVLGHATWHLYRKMVP
jgi:uncharacterized membrane protein